MNEKIIINCPNCKKTLRIPSNRGTLKVTCPYCSRQFIWEPDSIPTAEIVPVTTRKIWIPQVIASGMLLFALNTSNPYGYYILLRWVCSGIFAYLAFQAYDAGNDSWMWILGITAAVYNPIIPVHLNRDLWTVINLITVGIAITSIFVVKPAKKHQDNDLASSEVTDDDFRD